jgi:transposase InsO family protein
MSVSRVRENRMHGSMRRREATPASRASTCRAAAEASRRPYILDIFSRYVVGWTVQYRENAQLATALIEQATEQQQITAKILTLQADRGAPQRAKPVAFLLADLGSPKVTAGRTHRATTRTRRRASRR